MRIHLLDQFGLAVVDGGLADRIDADIGDLRLAAEGQRQLVGEGDRLDPAQFRRQPAHEAGAIVARAADGLAELDGVLGLEMAAAGIVRRSGERNERDLAFGPERIEAVAQRRVQSPVAIKRQRGVGIAGVRSRDRQRRPRGIIEIAACGYHDIGGVIGAAQEHHQQPRIGGGRRPDPACDGQRGGGGKGLDQFATVHERAPFRKRVSA